MFTPTKKNTKYGIVRKHGVRSTYVPYRAFRVVRSWITPNPPAVLSPPPMPPLLLTAGYTEHRTTPVYKTCSKTLLLEIITVGLYDSYRA